LILAQSERWRQA